MLRTRRGVVARRRHIEPATRDLERQFLVSSDALERLDAADAYTLEDRGLQRLRGRAAPVRVYALAAKP